MAEVRKYAVIGNPVAHSKSPRIHQLFAEQCNIALEYTTILVEAGQFETAVKRFARAGGSGLYVTVPF